MGDRVTRKLSLNKETLRELTDSELRGAAGGATTNCPKVFPGPTGCDNTGIICEYSERTCCFTN